MVVNSFSFMLKMCGVKHQHKTIPTFKLLPWSCFLFAVAQFLVPCTFHVSVEVDVYVVVGTSFVHGKALE